MNETTVKSMSQKDMERTIFQILVDNGMDEDAADKTVDNMGVKDMEKYLIDLDADGTVIEPLEIILPK